MRIIHVVARMITGASGPSYSVPSLCKALADQGAEVELHMVGSSPDIDSSIKVFSYAGITYLDRLGVSPEMKKGLIKAAKNADIMHSHSLWMMPNIYPDAATRNTERCKLVVSPRGTLSEWALSRSAYKKAVMWRLGQASTLRHADCIHATAPKEVNEIRKKGLSNPVTVIPNGIDIPSSDSLIAKSSGQFRKLLFLSRIHSTKGVDILLRVWKKLEHDYPDWQLDITGPMDGAYPQQMQELARKLSLGRCTFTGELTGESKFNAYNTSDLFVLPTHSENFGMVVAEALAHGTPVVVSKGAPWSGVVDNECGWWIDCVEAALEEKLRHAMSLPSSELSSMGAKGREWMRRDFSWDGISKRMIKSYEWILSGGKAPDHIYE